MLDVQGYVEIPEEPVFDENSAIITNPWLGLTNVGDSYSMSGYGGLSGRTKTLTITGVDVVLNVNCITLNEQVDIGLEYHDVWAAQDTLGNIRILKMTGVRGNGDPEAWEAERTSDALLFFPANPRVGQTLLFFLYVYNTFLDLNATVPQLSTGAGPYEGCWEISVVDTYPREPDPYAMDYRAPGVGWVLMKESLTEGWERNP